MKTLLLILLSTSLYSQTYNLATYTDVLESENPIEYDISGSTLNIGEWLITLDIKGKVNTKLVFNDIHYYGQTYICYYNFGRRKANIYITEDYVYLFTKNNNRFIRFRIDD